MARHRSILCLLAILCLLPLGAWAQSSSRVKALEKERKSLLQSIEKTSSEIRKLKENKNKTEKEVHLLQRQVSERTRLIEVLDIEIRSISSNIDSLGWQIGELQKRENENKQAYARSLRALQKQKNRSDRILFVLSSSSFDEGIRRSRFISQYAAAHKKAAAELQATQEALRTKHDEMVYAKKSKSDLLVLREREKSQLQKQESSKKSELKNLGSQQKKLESQLRKKQQQAQALDNKIQRQIAAEMAEAERKARAKENKSPVSKSSTTTKKTAREPATKGGYAMNEEEKSLAKTFAANKGKLPPPVDSRYSVYNRFGVNNHSTLALVKTNNAGIDLAVQAGASAVAVFDGVVTSVFVVPGFNTSVIIRHGNYLTVYSNLIQISVTKGQKVKMGHRLGKVAQDEESGKYLLKFQVWHERQKVNPELWIR